MPEFIEHNFPDRWKDSTVLSKHFTQIPINYSKLQIYFDLKIAI